MLVVFDRGGDRVPILPAVLAMPPAPSSTTGVTTETTAEAATAEGSPTATNDHPPPSRSRLEARRARKRRVANTKALCRHAGCSKTVNLSSRSKHEKRQRRHKACPPDCDLCLTLFFGRSGGVHGPGVSMAVATHVPIPLPVNSVPLSIPVAL